VITKRASHDFAEALESLALDDPPALWKDLQSGVGGSWKKYQDRLSFDLLELVIGESMLTPGANVIQCEANPEMVRLLGEVGARLALPEHVFWPMPEGGSVAWFGLQRVILRNDADTWLWAFAQSDADLIAIREAVPGDWDALSN
jgi:hypothetical protein